MSAPTDCDRPANALTFVTEDPFVTDGVHYFTDTQAVTSDCCSCCNPQPPDNLWASIFNKTGDCACLPDGFPLVRGAGTYVWDGTSTGTGGTCFLDLHMHCSGCANLGNGAPGWWLASQAMGAANHVPAATQNCDAVCFGPFHIDANPNSPNNACNGGFDVVVCGTGPCPTTCPPPPVPSDPYWCVVSGNTTACVQSATEPPDYASGPWPTAAACAAACPTGTPYWCTVLAGTTDADPLCVQASDPTGVDPDRTVIDGPFPDAGSCAGNCPPCGGPPFLDPTDYDCGGSAGGAMAEAPAMVEVLP